MVIENKGPEDKEGLQSNDNGLSTEDTQRLRQDPELTALIKKMQKNVVEAGHDEKGQAVQAPDVLEKNNQGQQK